MKKRVLAVAAALVAFVAVSAQEPTPAQEPQAPQTEQPAPEAEQPKEETKSEQAPIDKQAEADKPAETPAETPAAE